MYLKNHATAEYTHHARGNSCGHDRKNPRLSLSIPSTNRPPFLYLVGQKFRAYYYTPSLFPLLNHAFSRRQQRSERREACSIVMLVIFEFLDLTSLRIGIPTENGFRPLPLYILRRRTHLEQRRFERAMQTLQRAGIIIVDDQHTFYDRLRKTRVHCPCIRRVNPEFFSVLGLKDRLIEEQKKALKRLEKKAALAKKSSAAFSQYTMASAAGAYIKKIQKKKEAINARLRREYADSVQAMTGVYIRDGVAPGKARKLALKLIARVERERRRRGV